MKFAICNEIFFYEDKEKWTIRKQFEAAAELGFDGIEISPFTLNDLVQDITDEQKQEIRDASAATGVEVAGIHWLLIGPTGLHGTDPDPEVRARTIAYFEDLVRFGIEIGGQMMVVGSPKQRAIKEGVTYEQAWDWFKAAMTAAGQVGQAADFKVCIEPLYEGTGNNFIHRAEEARKMAQEIGLPNVGVILDTYSGTKEETDLPQAIRDTKDYLFHYHCNDHNGLAPGLGDLDFVPYLKALLDIDYQRFASIEVFDFKMDAKEHAAIGLKTLKEALAKAGG
ncbi:MAG: sugar phosphate isomerase/epimerase [Armatimonadetes bacterium]|nr:sugar phosphate isomerase/epimerase [Armatimonadota bacterium]